MRSGRRLGVILHGDDRFALVAEALQGLVVQIDVRELDVAILQRIFSHDAGQDLGFSQNRPTAA